MEQLKFGIVICSRLQSDRIPGKALKLVNGRPILDHLIYRLLDIDLPIILAIPPRDYHEYKEFVLKYGYHKKGVYIFTGSEHDPLERMRQAAIYYNLDAVIRISHDKIFVDSLDLANAINEFTISNYNFNPEKKSAEYLYASGFVDGTGFEIIRRDILEVAANTFQKVEHVSYAIRALTKNIIEFKEKKRLQDHRLLIDYPEDLQVIEVILNTLGNGITKNQALDYLDEHPNISRLNRLPLVSFYTCGFNASKWIDACMGSVSAQRCFNKCEYLLIDDCSNDGTFEKMAKFHSVYDHNTTLIRNQWNKGLASSSNIALTRARGKYIMRLDADDYLEGDNQHVLRMIEQIEKEDKDVLYPDNFHGSLEVIQSGNEEHHVGGALFRTRAANHVKFTEGLRGYEGYDFFKRAGQQLKVGYFETPTFFYRQHKESLSKNDLMERQRIKNDIDEKAVHGS